MHSGIVFPPYPWPLETRQFRIGSRILGSVPRVIRHLGGGGLQYHNIPGIDESSAYAQVVEAGDLVCIAGQVAADSAAGRAVLGRIGPETRAVMEQIRLILWSRRLTFDDVVRVDVHLIDLDDFQAMNEVYRGFFAPGRLPARTCVEVRRLFGDCRIEVTAMARRSRPAP